MDYNELRVFQFSKEVWSGSSTNGLKSGVVDSDFCNSWSSMNAGLTGGVGKIESSVVNWIDSGLTRTCEQAKHLYCINQTPEINGLNATMGTASGDIAVVFEVPTQTFDYKKIEIRETEGAVPPVNCVDSGNLAKSISIIADSNIILKLSSNTTYSLRVCVFDHDDDPIYQYTVSSILAAP